MILYKLESLNHHNIFTGILITLNFLRVYFNKSSNEAVTSKLYKIIIN